MHLRGTVAAVAGVCAAAIGHALDVSGRLPFVHEAASVRTAMSPAQLALWLAFAAVSSAFAARSRLVLVGAPAALAVSGAPELIGRHDLGAVMEPGALLGALLQLLLVAAVVALAVAVERLVVVLPVDTVDSPSDGRGAETHVSSPVFLVDRTAAPRGPPGLVVTTT